MKSLRPFLFAVIFASASMAAPNQRLENRHPLAPTKNPLAESIEIVHPIAKSNTRNALPLEEEEEEEVTTLDRFYRVYEDGTIEFKIVLSNGFAQYQRITNKVVKGKTIQVYQGYYSERLPDKTYRTTHYIADENGYRRLRREFDTSPPVLPPYVPYVPTTTQATSTTEDEE